MRVRGLLSRLRWRGISMFQRQEGLPPDREPVVSFTFDDFPRSALETGGTILKSHGALGTYYAAMGLMGQMSDKGEIFCVEDLKQLLTDGHELGSHSFSHLSFRNTSLNVFLADVQKGRDAVNTFIGESAPHHFCYPYGHFNLSVVHRLSRDMASCRSGVSGINLSSINLLLLRANALYTGMMDIGVITRLLRMNALKRGWLIFYTHDVRDKPSYWGCKPNEFEKVVRLALQVHSRILTVGAALKTLGLRSASLAFLAGLMLPVFSCAFESGFLYIS